MGMVLADSILGSYSTTGIEFSPLNRSKDLALELYFLPKRLKGETASYVSYCSYVLVLKEWPAFS
jgi:hypothetical protein